MADKIRDKLERFVPDLLLLQKRKIFSQEEIKEILSKREELEYILQRRTHNLKDYLKVLDYEYALERKRRLRVKELDIKKLSTRDFSIVKRILQIWDRIMNRYRYNVELWKQYLCFCYKIESKKQFFKVVSNALKFNPYNEDLWTLGALYEFEVAKNPFKARRIYYQGLKVLSKNDKLWKDYIDFELRFFELIKQREIEANNSHTHQDFLRLDIEEEEQDQSQMQIIKKEPKIEGIKTIIKLAIENCNNNVIYFNILEVLEQHNINELYQELRSQFIQKLFSSQQFDVYCELTIHKQQDIDHFIDQYGTQPNMLRALLKRSKGLENIDLQKIVKIIISNNCVEETIDDLIDVCQGNLKIKQQILKQLNSNQRIDKFKLLKIYSKLNEKCNDLIIEETMKKINNLKTKQEILDYLLILIKQYDNKQNILKLAKLHLFSQQQLFELFLDEFIKNIDENMKTDLLEWLQKQQQYCPLKYHLLNSNLSYSQLLKLTEYFPKQIEEIVKLILEKYPEKQQEIILKFNILKI